VRRQRVDSRRHPEAIFLQGGRGALTP